MPLTLRGSSLPATSFFQEGLFSGKSKSCIPLPKPSLLLLWCSLQGSGQTCFSTPLLLETSDLDGTFAYTLQSALRAYDELQGVSGAINCSSNF